MDLRDTMQQIALEFSSYYHGDRRRPPPADRWFKVTVPLSLYRRSPFGEMLGRIWALPYHRACECEI